MKPRAVRLSKEVVPTKYEIRLKPDLEAFVFEGEETIHLVLKKPTKTLTLHSKELEIESAAADGRFARKISYDEKAETATFVFDAPLPKGSVRLRLVFRGVLNDTTHGFYRSSFEHEGRTRHLATTQFESTDARRAFPCFDEPAMKAVFDVALTVQSDHTAISNTVPVDITEHEGGYKTVRFSPTPVMSTYLLAFIAGDFEHIEKKSRSGVIVRVFTTPGKKHQARFALECAAKIISFYSNYFGIPYPMPVVDLIAIPDFAAGAMENWGAITFRESALLVDAEHTSTMNKQRVALVIAHELAHQWFGNLVTMEWWTHLWLNEGFASFIEYLAVDHVFPRWDIWTQFLHADMRRALSADGLKNTHPIEVDVHHPSEIAAAFDAVSYSKGAAIIRMLADYLGEKDFRNGLRRYLNTHRFGNATTADLWRAFEKVSGKRVKAMMARWTGAPGYPLITLSERGNRLALEQSRFFASPLSRKETRDTTRWRVPIRARAAKGAVAHFLMTGRRLRLPAMSGGWLKLNANEPGFYRSNYPERMRQALGQAAARKELNTRDRLGLVRDTFALAETGAVSAADALAFAAHYARETEYVVWAELTSSLARIHSLLSFERSRAAFEKHALALFSKIGKKTTWRGKPSNHSVALLKVLVLGSLSAYGDTATVEHARRLFAGVRKHASKIPADVRGVVYVTVARWGGAYEHAKLIAMYRNAALHEEKNRIGGALTAFRQGRLLKKTLDFALSKDVRSQDSVFIIAGVAGNPAGSATAWKFIRAHWSELQRRYGGARELTYLVAAFGHCASVRQASELQAFFKKHPVPGTERTLQQTLERIRSNAAWLSRDRKKLGEFLRRADSLRE